MILIFIKAFLIAVGLWASYAVGRCTATYDWCDLATGKTKVAPDDIERYHYAYMKHYGGDSK